MGNDALEVIKCQLSASINRKWTGSTMVDETIVDIPRVVDAKVN